MTWPWRSNHTSQVASQSQVAAFVVGEQRTQMQCGERSFDVDVHDHGGVLPVRAARDVGVPAGLDQAHERVHGVRERRRAFGRRAARRSWSCFHSAISASRWDSRAASNFAASSRAAG